MRIEYHPAVADELLEIRDFYESRSTGLGSEFVSEFERQMFRIAAMP
jgi:toxin ParE1/3/4